MNTRLKVVEPWITRSAASADDIGGAAPAKLPATRAMAAPRADKPRNAIISGLGCPDDRLPLDNVDQRRPFLLSDCVVEARAPPWLGLGAAGYPSAYMP